jgi:uncharacterized protein YggE
MTLKTTSLATISFAVAVLLALASEASADTPGVTVSGAGTAKIRATVAEITATATAESDLATEAASRLRSLRTRGIEKLESLKIPSMSYESTGVSVTPAVDAGMAAQLVQGIPRDPVKQRLQASETFRITVKIERDTEAETLLPALHKIVDTCKEAGLAVGPPQPANYIQMVQQSEQGGATSTVIVFKAPTTIELRQESARAAMDDAKSKAQGLAVLEGAKLGKVESVTESIVPTTAAESLVTAFWNLGTGGGSREADLSSPVFGEISLTTRLTVRYALEK